MSCLCGPDRDIWALQAGYEFGALQTDILEIFVEHHISDFSCDVLAPHTGRRFGQLPVCPAHKFGPVCGTLYSWHLNSHLS